MGFKVNQDRAVVGAFAFGPIVHTKDPRRRMCGWSRLTHHANERCWARRHAEPLTEPCTNFSPKRKRYHLKDIMQARGFACEWFHNTRQTLGENALDAGGCATEELTDVKNTSNTKATPWQISRHTGIATVNSG